MDQISIRLDLYKQTIARFNMKNKQAIYMCKNIGGNVTLLYFSRMLSKLRFLS